MLNYRTQTFASAISSKPAAKLRDIALRRGAEAYGPYTKGALPVTVKEVSFEQRGDVTVRDVTFSPGPGLEVKAYLIAPKGNGPFAGILRVHWLGEEKSNRTQFREEAVNLHQRAASVLVDAM